MLKISTLTINVCAFQLSVLSRRAREFRVVGEVIALVARSDVLVTIISHSCARLPGLPISVMNVLLHSPHRVTASMDLILKSTVTLVDVLDAFSHQIQ